MDDVPPYVRMFEGFMGMGPGTFPKTTMSSGGKGGTQPAPASTETPSTMGYTAPFRQGSWTQADRAACRGMAAGGMVGDARRMASRGRYGDTMLVHMNPAEVRALAQMSPTGQLTINPDTGQPEAFLPMLAPILGSLVGGLGFSALGWSAALGAGLGSALATTVATGDVGKGIVSGLMGYGLGGLGDLIGGAAGSAAGEAVKGGAQGAAEAAIGEAAAQPMVEAANTAAQGAVSGAASGGAGATGMGSLGERIGDRVGGMFNFDKWGTGLENVMKSPALMKTALTDYGVPLGMGVYGMLAPTGGALTPVKKEQYPQIPITGTGRKYRNIPADPYGRENVYFDPVNFARGGYVSGPGGGLDDAIPAMINKRQPAQLSSGEYVVPAHAVSGLGDGSTEEGVRKLDGMVDSVMMHKYGTTNRKPRPMKMVGVAKGRPRPFRAAAT